MVSRGGFQPIFCGFKLNFFLQFRFCKKTSLRRIFFSVLTGLKFFLHDIFKKGLDHLKDAFASFKTVPCACYWLICYRFWIVVCLCLHFRKKSKIRADLFWNFLTALKFFLNDVFENGLEHWKDACFSFKMLPRACLLLTCCWFEVIIFLSSYFYKKANPQLIFLKRF